MGRSEWRYRLGSIASVEDPDLATIFESGCGFVPMGRLSGSTCRISRVVGRSSGSTSRAGRAVDRILTTIFGGGFGSMPMLMPVGGATLGSFSFITTSILSGQLVDAGCRSKTVLDGAEKVAD